jgi:hypothetical protein
MVDGVENRYALLLGQSPPSEALGMPAALTIYGSTHASALPTLRIQEPPRKLPISAVPWEGTLHAVFGLVLVGLWCAFVRLADAAAGSDRLGRPHTRPSTRGETSEPVTSRRPPHAYAYTT